ncbi:unnamed protein product [Haemonchus placei]|uniref:Nucleic acid-binding protein n=1 Tax=Haemonchus placei TaxID=6290 RepID=A0A0N4WS82_HAEPC|nr:unnamed protein product [Haemonchus placei]
MVLSITEAILPVDEEGDAMDIEMDVFTHRLISPNHEPVCGVSILAAVDPNVIENLQKNSDCSNLIELRKKGEPLPKMSLVVDASLEEQNLFVRGLVLDGKRGIALTKLMIGDLVWVYSLAVTVKFATLDMELPRTVTGAIASHIEMEEGYLDVTIRLDTNDEVRSRAYLLTSKIQRIAIVTFLHTLDERANSALALMEHSSAMTNLTPNTVGWIAARLLLAGEVQVSGYDYPYQDAITVTEAG